MKWHEAESNPELLELWVADMDFLPVPLRLGMQSSTMLETHIFAILIRDELLSSIINWKNISYVVDKEYCAH